MGMPGSLPGLQPRAALRAHLAIRSAGATTGGPVHLYGLYEASAGRQDAIHLTRAERFRGINVPLWDPALLRRGST
jgi:hypothetical protein